jgi:hypothetical protein
MEINSQNEVVLSSPNACFRESVVWQNGMMYLHSDDYHKYISDELLASMSDDKRDEVLLAMDLLQSAHPRAEFRIEYLGSWDD